jgi:hypothetical protein
MKSKHYTSITDFTSEQIQKFDTMHTSLRDYNSALRKGLSPPALTFPDEDMAIYSIYRQLILADKVKG